MKRKAVIISLKGTSLTKKEKSLLKNEKPWGVILFERNLKSISQIKKLTSKIKDLTRNKTFPIIIDEEGGSVSRLRKIIDHNLSANFFGNLFKNNKNICLKVFKLYLFSICSILKDLGINVNTIPVLDIVRYNTNKIIGNRSFSNDKIVKILGNLTINH